MNNLVKISEIAPITGFILIVLLISFNTLSLKKKGIKVSSRETGKSKWIYFPFAVFSFLFLSEIAAPLTGFSLLPGTFTASLFDSAILRLLGIFTVLISVMILNTTLRHFKESLRFGLNENNTGKLVTVGIFRLTRNPFFLSLLFYFTGTTMLFPNIFFIVFSLAAFAGIHLSILKEEKFLQKVYGEDYKKYAAKVRRYF